MTAGSKKEHDSLNETQVEDSQNSSGNESISSRPDTLENALTELRTLQAKLNRQNLELQASQQSLHETLDHFTEFYDFAPIGYLSFDSNGNILNINRTAAEMLGDNHASFINQSFTPLLIVGQEKVFIQHIRQAFNSGKKQSLELNIRNHQEKQLWIRLESTKLGQYIQTAIIDITDRKHAEQELEKNQFRYQSLFEDSPLPQWEEDFSQIKAYFDELRGQGVRDFAQHFRNHPQVVQHCASLMRILDVNKASVQLFEADNKEELIQNLQKSFTDASWLVFTEELITLAEGKTKFSSEAMMQTLSGKPLTVSLQLEVTPGHETSLAKVLLAMNDITAKKQAEEALQVANRELEARVRNRTAELAQANENLHKEIKERQIAELALASSEEKYRLVFSNESDAILLFDVDSKQMLEVNDAAI
ncbi:MAG: PAS domain S-box protein, partial [Gammaproteobacteria bacterium]|nr:PAS domain S-box protein [Gammaproteobacteria bacterium]